MKKRTMYLRMITASLMRRRSRMLVALLSIAIGAMILLGLVTIYYDVPRQMGAQFRNYGANMIFTAAEDSFGVGEMNSCEEMIDKKNIVGITPYRYENVRIRENPVMAAGTDMESVKKTSPYWSIEGEMPKSENEILLGAAVAQSFNAKAGDELTVSYTPENAAIETADNTLDVKVAGILQTGGSEEDYVYMNMKDLETLTEKNDIIHLAEVSVSASGDELSGYADKINNMNGKVKSRLVKRVTASETTVLTKLQALVLLVTVVVLALTMICVATTMTAVVAERRQEIGLKKAIGASNKSIIGDFMGECVLLGMFGGILGAVLGYFFAQQVSVNVFNSAVSVQPLLFPITVIVAVAVTAISALMPISSATKIEPALVLKGE